MKILPHTKAIQAQDLPFYTISIKMNSIIHASTSILMKENLLKITIPGASFPTSVEQRILSFWESFSVAFYAFFAPQLCSVDEESD